MAAVCHTSPSLSDSYITSGNATTHPSPSIPLSRRRKVLFLYHSLHVSGPAFQWACDNLLRPGYDHVTLLNTFTDEAYQIVDAKKLWKVATEEITVEVEYKKKLDRLEQELEIFRLSLLEMDIAARKVIMPEGDSKANIVNTAHSLNAELIIMSSNPVNGLQRAIYGSLEDYLLRHCPCSVVVAKPRARSSRSPSLIGTRRSSSNLQFSSPVLVGTPTAVHSPVAKPVSFLKGPSTPEKPEPTLSALALSEVKPELSVKPSCSDSAYELSPNLQASDRNAFGLAVEDHYTLNSSEYSETEEANALSAFQEQLVQYQSRTGSVDMTDSEWGLGLPGSTSPSDPVPSSLPEEPASPIASPLSPVTPQPLNQTILPPRQSSVLFKPPPPQPRVKSIIDNLPRS